MNILIDIGHPAHVHLFKNFAKEMIKKGHKILFTCRDKEFEIYLLKYYNLPYISFGKKYISSFGKLFGMFKFDFKETKVALKFKPDIFMSHGSMYAAHASFLIHKPHVSFEDTFNFEQIRLYKPFTNIILTSDYPNPLKGPKIIKYSGFHALAYLHPKNFTIDTSVLNLLKVEKNEKFVLIRFVAWNATHDKNHSGMSYSNKLKAIHEFSKIAKVFISSESALPIELEKYKIHIPAEKMHSVIALASLVFGESSTMCEESAMLGTPSIYIDSTCRIYTKLLESEYDLMFNYTETEKDQLIAINKGIELLRTKNIKENWLIKTNKMISEKIDVTSFLVWFVEKYPESVRILILNPTFQKKFK